MFIATLDGDILTYDILKDQEVIAFDTRFLKGRRIFAIKVFKNNLYSCYGDSTIRIFGTSTGKLKGVKKTEQPISDIAIHEFNKERMMFVAHLTNTSVYLWDKNAPDELGDQLKPFHGISNIFLYQNILVGWNQKECELQFHEINTREVLYKISIPNAQFIRKTTLFDLNGEKRVVYISSRSIVEQKIPQDAFKTKEVDVLAVLDFLELHDHLMNVYGYTSGEAAQIIQNSFESGKLLRRDPVSSNLESIKTFHDHTKQNVVTLENRPEFETIVAVFREDPVNLYSGQKFGNFKEKAKAFYTSLPMESGSVELILDEANLIQSACEEIFKMDTKRFYNKILILNQEKKPIKDFYMTFSHFLLNSPIVQRVGYNNVFDLHGGFPPEEIKLVSVLAHFVGMCLLQNISIPIHLSHSLCKIILRKPLTYNDLKDTDQKAYVLVEKATNYSDLESIPSSHLEELQLGTSKNISKSNLTVKSLLEAYTKWKLFRGRKREVEIFLRSLFEIIPQNHFLLFNESEIEYLIAGENHVDIEKWKQNTMTMGFESRENPINTFWEVIKKLSCFEQKRLFVECVGKPDFKTPLELFVIKKAKTIQVYRKANLLDFPACKDNQEVETMISALLK